MICIIETLGLSVRIFFRVRCTLQNLFIYRTLAIITRGFYYFSIFSHVGVSLMFGSVTMTLGGYKTRAVIIRARLMMASVRYVLFKRIYQDILVSLYLN